MDDFHGTNRNKATDAQLFALCDQLMADEGLIGAFREVGVDGYFKMKDYLNIHHKITNFWQAAAHTYSVLLVYF
ncbi:MAG: hypothetical protein P8P98_06850 [Emcibacteraceae bacterium]|nr:hypothetical protein [Emcibacteraceae bacterium]MDG1996935.1 hypothetical protein [Emcibacteraceae bacterium]